VARPQLTDKQMLRRTAAVIGAAVLVASFGSACTEAPDRSDPGAQIPEVSAPNIKQAAWRIKAKQIGSVGKVTRADKKRLRAQRPRLKGLIKDVYDSLFLFPSRKRISLREHFTRRAARKVLATKAGISPRAERVRTWSRRATIGVQPNNAAVAAAQVYIRATGKVDNKIFRLVHRATLWLQRARGAWKVVGFEVNQGPVKKSAQDKKKERKKKRHHKRSPKKRGRNA
jgi:hypothetical protein